MHEYTKYFKSSKGFDRLIEKIYEKYKSLSKFSGIIKLNNLSLDEATCLSRFLGMNINKGEDISISIKKIIDIMNNSKYDDFDIEVLVQEYLNIPLVTNKEKKEKEANDEINFYNEIIDNSIGGEWLKEIVILKENPYRLISQRYHKNKIALKKELLNIICMINNLPSKPILISIFASKYTKDPHYLDLDNNHCLLFMYALSSIGKVDCPITREETIKLLAKYNIEIDNLSNYAITYNLLANKDYITKFALNNETLILNIQNIITTDYFDTKKKQVFIFENPSILTELLSKNINASVIISGGFPNTSVYLLLDKLLETNNKLYYNGDFDPEGLLIAQKLKEKYNDKLELICYSKLDYETCISKKKINNSRLKKLSKVKDKDLLVIKEILLETKYSAYQENNKERIIEFIDVLDKK